MKEYCKRITKLFIRKKGGVAFYVNDHLECTELHLGTDEELTEILGIRIKGRARTDDITVGVWYRPHDQED